MLLTGATGFLGKAFCRIAEEKNFEIGILERKPERLAPASSGESVFFGTLENPPWEEIRSFAPEALLHFAWIAEPGVYLTSPRNTWWRDVSIKLFENAIEAGISHVIGVGSCAEYAPSPDPLSEETSTVSASSEYAARKIETSVALAKIAEERNGKYSWVRVFYPYGHGEHPNRLPSFAARTLRSGAPVSLKTPHSLRDYIHVDDVADGFAHLLKERLGGVYNMGSGEGIEIGRLVERIGGILGYSGETWVPCDSSVDPNPCVVADTRKMCRSGWEPRISLDDGLAQLLEQD